MANYVCRGAKLICSMGDSRSLLEVLPDRRVNLGGLGMANIMDNKSISNIKPFGLCMSLSNPAVAAATITNFGILTPMPCLPNISGPWMTGETGVLVKGQPALLNTCRLTCLWSGIIRIADDGQSI